MGVLFVFLKGFIDVSGNFIFYVSSELVQIPRAPWEDPGVPGRSLEGFWWSLEVLGRTLGRP